MNVFLFVCFFAWNVHGQQQKSKRGLLNMEANQQLVLAFFKSLKRGGVFPLAVHFWR